LRFSNSTNRYATTALALALISTPLFATSAPTDQAEQVTDQMIAVVSGIRPPHQGFAFSVDVPSNDLCFSVAMNLASELGISVHVMCLSQSSGKIISAGECGFAQTPEATEVTSHHSKILASHSTPYLTCVPIQRERFPATQIPPDLTTLRR